MRGAFLSSSAWLLIDGISMTESVGWFEIYVHGMNRATKFYEIILGTQLEVLNSPVPESKMMACPVSVGTIQCGGCTDTNARR